MSKQLKALEEMLAVRRLHPAMRMEEDIETAKAEGEELHPLVLSPTRANRALAYIHPQRLLNELEERGEFLNLVTLEFEKKKTAPTSAPAEPTATDAPPIDDTVDTEHRTPDDAAEEVPGLKKLDTYTKKELKAMKKDKLLKIAGVDPDVNTKGVKDDLIKKLTGRPKFPLK